MAIQKEHGDSPDAYWMICKLMIDKRSKGGMIRVDVYSSAQSKLDGDEPIAGYGYELFQDSYDDISENGVSAAYGVLKTGLLQGGIDV